MTVGSLTALACVAGCGALPPNESMPSSSPGVESIRVSDLEKVQAADLGDRLTIVDVPDPRAPDIGNSLESMAVSEDAVWVVSHRGGIVSRIDPATNAVVAAIESPILPGCIPNACVGLGAVATAGEHVWFLNQYLESFPRIDATSNEIIGSKGGATRFEGLLGADGLIWSGNEGGDGAVGMDPASGEVSVTVADGSGLYPAGFAAGSIWFAGDECRELLRVDPATGDVQSTIPIDTCVGDVVEAADEIWAGTFKGILRIDPTSSQEVGWISIRTENDRFSLAVVDDSVWFRGEVTEIVRLDPVTKQPVERIALPFGQYQGEIGVADGSLWVANWGEGTVYRIDS
jgi:streptogramin lyase